MLVCLCENCGKRFRLTFEEYPKREEELPASDIEIRACESGGVYAAHVVCPHCKYQHDLDD